MTPDLCPCGASAVAKGKCRRCYARTYYAAKRRSAVPESVAPPARHVELDALLSEWRSANPGSIVQVGQNGVVLHRLGGSPLRFRTTDEAIEFLTRPAKQSCKPTKATISHPRAARERISIDVSDRREYMRLYHRARRARLARARAVRA